MPRRRHIPSVVLARLQPELAEVRAQNKRLREALQWLLKAYENEFISDPPQWQKAKAVAEEKPK
jgi:hypothetical protein